MPKHFSKTLQSHDYLQLLELTKLGLYLLLIYLLKLQFQIHKYESKTEIRPSCHISKRYKTNKNQALLLIIQILGIILSKCLTFQHFCCFPIDNSVWIHTELQKQIGKTLKDDIGESKILPPGNANIEVNLSQ